MNKTTYKGQYNKDKNKTYIIEKRWINGTLYADNIRIIGEYDGKPDKSKTTSRKYHTYEL